MLSFFYSEGGENEQTSMWMLCEDLKFLFSRYFLCLDDTLRGLVRLSILTIKRMIKVKKI